MVAFFERRSAQELKFKVWSGNATATDTQAALTSFTRIQRMSDASRTAVPFIISLDRRGFSPLFFYLGVSHS